MPTHVDLGQDGPDRRRVTVHQVLEARLGGGFIGVLPPDHEQDSVRQARQELGIDHPEHRGRVEDDVVVIRPQLGDQRGHSGRTYQVGRTEG